MKEVNKATCRKCGHRMLIRKAGDDLAGAQDEAAAHQGFRAAAAAAAAAASVPRPEPIARTEWEEEDPTHIAQLDERGEPVIPGHAAP
ncbi:hypothetical protein L6R53_31385, partial [Myxococcota bacterium]|nr:hypothetical protein [Myxococcota bacterium]